MSSSAPSSVTRSATSGRAGSPLPTRERRSGFVALGVVLIISLAAIGVWLYSTAGAKTSVVVMVRPVAAGHAITRDDVSTVAVAGGVTAIGGNHLESVIGQSAAVTLLPNMLLQRSMTTGTAGLDPQEAEVGVAVTSGQVPADGLAPGDTVRVVQLPSDNASADASSSIQELVERAAVYAVRADPAQAGGTLLTLRVPAGQADAVAMASSVGKIAVIRVAAGR